MVFSGRKNAKYYCRTLHLDTHFDCRTEGILQAYKATGIKLKNHCKICMKSGLTELSIRKHICLIRWKVRCRCRSLLNVWKCLKKSSQETAGRGKAFVEKYKEYTEMKVLTAEIAEDVVKRVTVHRGGWVAIELALRDELEDLPQRTETADDVSKNLKL